ncbi:MAG: 50S ribosomal protein L22 [Armatimonadetes bacterium]|nr:50S ribosomal protein L22 [Armatimonadota bacterium]
MEAKATAKYVRMNPRKVRFVLQTIKGKYAQDAMNMLRIIPNHAADEIANVLRSAMANAVTNHGMSGEYLKVAGSFVDPGPTQKRVQPRAQGRAYRILKRTSHITIIVEEGTPPPVTGAKELALKRRGPKPPLLAAIASPEVIEETPVAETVDTVEEVAPETTEATSETVATTEDAPVNTEGQG